MTRTLKRFALIVLLAVCGLTASRTDAYAGYKAQCSVSAVFYDQNRLCVNCTDGWYAYGYAYGPANCKNQNIDTIKIWESMLTTSLLSNKKVDITFEDAVTGCPDVIIGVKLLRN